MWKILTWYDNYQLSKGIIITLALTRTGVDGHDLWTSQLDLPAGSDRFELPIPQAEIDANGELTNNDQNPAYK